MPGTQTPSVTLPPSQSYSLEWVSSLSSFLESMTKIANKERLIRSLSLCGSLSLKERPKIPKRAGIVSLHMCSMGITKPPAALTFMFQKQTEKLWKLSFRAESGISSVT